jgi:hypothetical protein
VWDAAYATFAHTVDAAVAAEATRLGRALSWEERGRVAKPIIDARMPALYPTFEARLAATPQERATLVAGVVATRRAVVAAKRDPFTPLAARDPAARAAARAGEMVLWENAGVMVLVDIKADGPKLLVVPKAPTMFPVDAQPALLRELARVAAVAADSLAQAGRSAKPVDVWVNPPQNLHLRQLHVHVEPYLNPWPRWAATPRGQEAAMRLFYDDVRRRLATKLGPAS